MHTIHEDLTRLQQEKQQLLADCSEREEDLRACCSQLQRVVAAVAACVPLPHDVAQGLQDMDMAVFSRCLSQMREVRWAA